MIIFAMHLYTSMKVFEFNKYFPNEAACRMAFKEIRDREGVTCKHCRHRTTLRSGTVMHGSKLPFMYWFIAMHLMTATKKSISAAELQRQLGTTAINLYGSCYTSYAR